MYKDVLPIFAHKHSTLGYCVLIMKHLLFISPKTRAHVSINTIHYRKSADYIPDEMFKVIISKIFI